jgi:hypothetical protein
MLKITTTTIEYDKLVEPSCLDLAWLLDSRCVFEYDISYACFCVSKVFLEKIIYFYFIYFELIFFGVFRLFWCTIIKNNNKKIFFLLF